LYHRTVEELIESTRFGKLYQVRRKHGKHYVACRVRRKGDGLFLMPAERVTIEKTEASELEVDVGDFAFLDAGKTWALWKPSKPIEVR
jgi:hypothetical protein